jgi:hypothetical protein
MVGCSNSSNASLIPQVPIPEGVQDFSKRMLGLMDGQTKNDEVVEQALEGMDATLDAIAAGMYSLGSMLVGEGEAGVRLVETTVATAEVSICHDLAKAKRSSHRALAASALATLETREPGCLAAPEGLEPGGCCVEDGELEASGISKVELESIIAGPDRGRVRAWLEKLPTDVRTVFVLRAVAGFTAGETAGLLAAYGGPQAAGWNAEAVRSVFRLGLCSLASQLLQESGKS